MNQGKNVIRYVACIILGAILLGLGYAGIVDDFWTGMGVALVMVGVVRSVRLYRFCKDETYREKVEIDAADERNRFIRNKAWAWAGYLFIIICGASVFVLKILGQEMLCQVASVVLCLLLLLYWGSYFVLKKKY